MESLPDPQKFVFNETDMERMMALTGTHAVLYAEVIWRVTVEKLTPDVLTFVLTPIDLSRIGLHPIAFYYHTDTSKLRFTSGDIFDLSFVLDFLNGYVPCDLGIFRR